MTGIHREGGEDREDPLRELAAQPLAVVVVELCPGGEADPGTGQLRANRSQEDLIRSLHERTGAFGDQLELFVRSGSVGSAAPHTRGHLVLQAGDPDLEELVEGLAEDGQELRALQ